MLLTRTLIAIKPLGQRDPQWAQNPLGTSLSTTIGSHGCTLTAATMLHNYYYPQESLTPDVLNRQDLYVNQNLFAPTKFVRQYPAIRFEEIGYYPDPIPADIAKIKAHLDQGHPIFVWLHNEGVFHCTLAVGHEQDDRGVDQIIVNDPWQGDQVRIDKRWGDSKTVILEADYYAGHAREIVRAPAKCQDIAEMTGKHLLFLGIGTQAWSLPQFVEAAKFAHLHHVDSLLVKFADGGNVWYGGIDGFRRIRDAIKLQGVGVIPYMYSYGNTFSALESELNLLAEYLQDNGVVCANMEREWEGKVDWASHMSERLKTVPGVFLVSTFGAPDLHDWGGVIHALSPRVDAYMPQQYTNYLASCWQQFAQSGAQCLQPTIDLSQEFTEPNDPIANTKAAYSQGHTALSVWHYDFAVEKPDLLDGVFQAFPKEARPETNEYIRQELDSCWNSTAHLFDGNPPPMNTGIHESWVKAWLFHNYHFGPPVTKEYTSTDSEGNPITAQECIRARCEWDKHGVPHWFTAHGPIRL